MASPRQTALWTQEAPRSRRLRTVRPQRPGPRRPAPVPLSKDPFWYKDAVIYEVHVRAFFDSNADGIGDFRGLTQKLDYLQDLGVIQLLR